MTLDELLSDKTFLNTAYRIGTHSQNYYYTNNNFMRTFMYCAIVNKLRNTAVLYDYTPLIQDEINALINTQLKYDFFHISYDTYYNSVTAILMNSRACVRKYALSDLTPDLLHEIIHKNEVFIANLNSLYASNKILYELDAL